MQASPVTMSRLSLRTAAPPCLLLDIKDSLKEDRRLLLWGIWFGAFALGFWPLDFWLFGVGGFWKGKKLLKVKELPKENC
jgi:hypothetical protein